MRPHQSHRAVTERAPQRQWNTGGKGRVKGLVTALVLGVLWLLMSGLFKPLLLSFGAGSVAVVLWVMARMNRIDGYTPQWRLKPIAFIGYFFWLMKEIAKANWQVTKAVLTPKMGLRQHLFAVPVSQQTDVAQVTFANSITLTPGTITIETEPGRFLVHALSYSQDTPAELAEMDSRVTAIEARRG